MMTMNTVTLPVAGNPDASITGVLSGTVTIGGKEHKIVGYPDILAWYVANDQSNAINQAGGVSVVLEGTVAKQNGVEIVVDVSFKATDSTEEQTYRKYTLPKATVEPVGNAATSSPNTTQVSIYWTAEGAKASLAVADESGKLGNDATYNMNGGVRQNVGYVGF